MATWPEPPVGTRDTMLYLHMSDVQIHWFAICNSVAIVLFLSGEGRKGGREGGKDRGTERGREGGTEVAAYRYRGKRERGGREGERKMSKSR